MEDLTMMTAESWNRLVWGSALYVGTGVLQPVVVDWLRLHHGLGRHGLLLPTWANTVGMAACGMLASRSDWSTAKRQIRIWDTTNTADRRLRRRLWWTACIDLVSGMLLTGGLLWTGGSIFVVLYNSVPVWTAVQARCGLGQTLTRGQSMGVLLVSVGLASQVLSSGSSQSSATEQLNHQQNNHHKIVLGSIMVLLGSFLHGTMFILTESTLSSTRGVSSQVWCSMMGCLEACFMTLWVLVGSVVWGFHDENASTSTTSPPVVHIVGGLTALVMIDVVHAAAFFMLLQHLGAIGSALLKGGQTVTVVILSAVLFCGQEETQCLTTTKTFSLVLVLTGMTMYATSKRKSNNTEKGLTDKTDVESLLS